MIKANVRGVARIASSFKLSGGRLTAAWASQRDSYTKALWPQPQVFFGRQNTESFYLSAEL
jgi:hypothetical protein